MHNRYLNTYIHTHTHTHTHTHIYIYISTLNELVMTYSYHEL